MHHCFEKVGSFNCVGHSISGTSDFIAPAANLLTKIHQLKLLFFLGTPNVAKMLGYLARLGVAPEINGLKRTAASAVA